MKGEENKLLNQWSPPRIEAAVGTGGTYDSVLQYLVSIPVLSVLYFCGVWRIAAFFFLSLPVVCLKPDIKNQRGNYMGLDSC